VDGLYLPECWLKPGRNTLVIFDEEGHRPDRVKIVEETVADRVEMELATREVPAPSR